MTKQQILQTSGASDVVAKDGIIGLIYPYKPYFHEPDTLMLDSYYVASNLAYCRAKKSNIGLITNDINIKKFLTDCGLKMTKSSLVVHPHYGTYFLVQTIVADFVIEDIFIQCAPPKCDSCTKCITACNANALTANGFIRNNCIRNMMDEALSESNITYLGNDLLGCRICRNVCPYNSDVQKEKMPSILRKALNLEAILTFNHDTRNILTDYIGKNMARASVLIPQALAIACKKDRTDLLPIISKLTNHQSPKVAQSAKFVLNLIKSKSN